MCIRDSLDSVFDRCEGCITDGVGVLGNCGDDIAGGGQLLTVFALFGGLGDRLKSVSCAEMCIRDRVKC